MKKITTLALALVTGAALAGPVMAAPKPGPNPDRMVEHMAKELDLNADQQARIKTIMEEQGKKMRALHDETESRVKAVLTPEQQAKAEAMRDKRREKWEERKEKMQERRGKE
ncbi:Spy/CpxP family protein refolding chaperone [Alloalcanivorax gelatiniphagus]|uniref:Periplasmic heavy metal sensor n=1 Tax=Alloalcanivorax gelatiniphagus TaxID=1194167 RepID=A0ABY2XFU9_9GAMM|nr:periplasmic heavy metal sensor [Alloalcanivorax gelatiniphagus]TMW10484.1 periplasmic heavy metal sensor [Alloalcanivorax gelatiniphagus]|tara:strand:- start:3665 stop:4000 length:336 start_codon:yes stop_codon:yes gene_type:complete